MIKKVIYSILATTLLFSIIFMLFSCNTIGNTEQTTSVTGSQTKSNDIVTDTPFDTDIMLGTDKVAVYDVVCPDITATEISNLGLFLRDKIKERSGVSLEYKTDIKRSSDEANSATNEILIGYTNHPESLGEMNDIGYLDYAIKVVGNKIVIVAHNGEKLEAAVNYFIANMLFTYTKDDGTTELYARGEYIYHDNTELIFTNEHRLEDCVIVYSESEGNLSNAQQLQKAIKDGCGCTLGLVSDSIPAVKNEIIVGKTNRSESKQLFEGNNAVKTYECVVAAVNGKLIIESTSYLITSIAIDKFISDNIKPYYSNTMNLASDYLYIYSAFDGVDSPTLYSGSDIRVMSFNVLSEEWGALVPVPDRAQRTGVIINTYLPDVIGLQEMSNVWYSELTPLIKDTYEYIYPKNTFGVRNYTSIAYNTKTLRLIEYGMYAYNAGYCPEMRIINWGYFEHIETGEKFVVVNTHLSIEKAIRTEQMPEFADYVNNLREKYNCPIICVGDVEKETNAEFAIFTEATGFKDAKYTANIISRNNLKTMHAIGETPVKFSACVDHILVSPDTNLIFYNQLIDKVTLGISDHCPIYADIKLTK